MASTAPKVPIPLPVGGVHKDRNPRQVGANALVDSKNWVYRDGYFRVRDGLRYLSSDYQPNVIPTDAMAYMNATATAPSGSMYPQMYIIDFPATPAALAAQWWGWTSADSVQLSVADTITQETWGGGDPDFLNHGGDGFTQVNADKFTGTDVTIISPIVAISAGTWTGQVKVACNSTDASVTVRMIGFNHKTKAGPIEEWYRDDYHTGDDPDPYYLGTPVTLTNLTWDDPEDADDEIPYVTLENTYGAEYAALMITFTMDSATDEWGVGEAMISAGAAELQFYAPSGADPVYEYPLALYDFQADEDSRFTVIATDIGLWDLQSDYSWDSIHTWNSALSDRTHMPVFRGYSGQIYDASTADTYMLAVTPGARAVYWDGDTASAVEFTEKNDGITYMSCKAVATCFRRVLYCGLTADPLGLYYSELYFFNQWAGNQIRLVDTPGIIMAALEIGNTQTVIYKSDAIYVVIGQGASVPFRVELKTANVDGPASPRAVTAISTGLHVYLSHNGDVIMFDGVRPRSLGQHIQSYIQSNMDFENIDRSWVMYDKQFKNLYIFYPPYGSTKGFNCVIVDMSTEQPTVWPQRWPASIPAGGSAVIDLSISIDELGETPIDDLAGAIDDYATFRPEFLLVDDIGRAIYFNGYTDFDSPIESYLETGLYDMGEIGRYKTVQEIDHLIEAGRTGDEALTVQLLKSTGGHERELDSSQTINVTQPGRKITRHKSTGRLFSLRFSAQTSTGLEWLGSEAAVVMRGLR